MTTTPRHAVLCPPGKSDPKDALTIARLAKDGRWLESYIPDGVFADLRSLSSEAGDIDREISAYKNRLLAVYGERFPELPGLFSDFFGGKASGAIAKQGLLPERILELGAQGVLAEIKKEARRAVGIKMATKIYKAAESSIGVKYGQQAASKRIQRLWEGLSLLVRQAEALEADIAACLEQIPYAKSILECKGIGVKTLGMILGETGDLLRFSNYRQIVRLAGMCLVENSSGKSKSGTEMSKRGRSRLRGVLYQSAWALVGNSPEIYEYYLSLKARKQNPLCHMQAMGAVMRKLLEIMHTIARKGEAYDPQKAFGQARQEIISQTDIEGYLKANKKAKAA